MDANDSALRQQLYKIFRIKDEDYLTTVKVMYIYRCAAKTHPNPLNLLFALYGEWPSRRNTQKLDGIFYHFQSNSLKRLAAPPGAIVPPSKRYIGIHKW